MSGDKVYERTENGTVTHVSVREALAEVNRAMMDGKRDVREMSSGRGQHVIAYKDGRTVRLILVDAPVEQPETALIQRRADGNHIMGRVVTVQGKRYVVSTARKTAVDYWSERNGERFGAARSTNGNAKPGTVGRAIWDAVSEQGR